MDDKTDIKTEEILDITTEEQNIISNNEALLKQYKKEDRTKSYRVWLAALIGGFLGFLAGVVMDIITKKVNNFHDLSVKAGKIAVYGVCPVVEVLILISLITCFVMLVKNKRRILAFDPDNDENDDEGEKLDRKLGIIMSVVNVSTVIGYCLYGFWIEAYVYLYPDGIKAFMYPVIGILAIIVLFIVDLAKATNQIKILYPEKKVSAYDFNFAKKWVDSSDEAQLFNTYKAAYKAYKVASWMCIFLWVICILIGLAFKPDILAISIVSIIWITITIVFSRGTFNTTNR